MAVNISPFLYQPRLPMHGGGPFVQVDNAGSAVGGIGQLLSAGLAGYKEGLARKRREAMEDREVALREIDRLHNEWKSVFDMRQKIEGLTQEVRDPVTGEVYPTPYIDITTGMAANPLIQEQYDAVRALEEQYRNAYLRAKGVGQTKGQPVPSQPVMPTGPVTGAGILGALPMSQPPARKPQSPQSAMAAALAPAVAPAPSRVPATGARPTPIATAPGAPAIGTRFKHSSGRTVEVVAYDTDGQPLYDWVD